jgi:hypothetical protein
MFNHNGEEWVYTDLVLLVEGVTGSSGLMMNNRRRKQEECRLEIS